MVNERATQLPGKRSEKVDLADGNSIEHIDRLAWLNPSALRAVITPRLSLRWCENALNCLRLKPRTAAVNSLHQSLDSEAKGGDYPLDDWLPWTVDVGSSALRCGWASAIKPHLECRCAIGRFKPTLDPAILAQVVADRSEDGVTVLGAKLNGVEALLDITECVSADRVDNWDDLALNMASIIPQTASSLILAAPLGFGRPSDHSFVNFGAQALDTAFESLEIDCVSVVSAVPLALFGAGVVQGVALCAGHWRTVASIVTDGKADPCHTVHVGGRDRLPDGTCLNSLFDLGDQKCPVDALAAVVATRHSLEIDGSPLYLSGGASFFEGYRSRLESDLKNRPRLSSLQISQASDACAAWRGAAVLGQSPEFYHWASRHDVQEQGAWRIATTFSL